MRVSFGDYEIDYDARELRRGQTPVTMEAKAFDTLSMLITHKDRVVTKEELIETVWQGRFISDSALSTAIKAARKAVGDNGRDQAVIRTVHGHGFRFVAKLEAGPDAPPADQRHSEAAQTPGNLKRRRRVLTGRDAEKSTIKAHLRNFDIVSVVGPGGAGKTSLAIDTAMDLGDIYTGGVWFCELAPVQEDQVESAVMGAIDSSAGAGKVVAEQIAERFGDAPTLLVLDNCEHVVGAAASLAEDLYHLVPRLAILTTSREALEIPDEKVIRLGGLSYQSSDGFAVEMFHRCARQVTDLAQTEATKETVRQITERLEGLPLAIELAAPQLASRTPDELLHALDDQLSILATRRPRGQARHSAMDDAIAWSFDLLAPEQRDVLTALSLFSGAFTAQAAEAICAQPSARGLLHDLVGQSMVTFVPGAAVSRFRLLEPIRQFARRQLGADRLETLRERHATFFAQRGIELAQDMRGAGEIEACEALTAEWSDFGRALAWGRSQKDAGIAVAPLLALDIHLLWQARKEAFGWLEAAVEVCDLGAGLQAEADIVRSMGAWSAGDLERCTALLDASAAQAGEVIGNTYMRFYVNFVSENFPAAVASGRKTLELARQTDDPTWRIKAPSFLACALPMTGGEPDEIQGLLDETQKAVTQHPWPSGQCCLLLSMLMASFGRGASDDVARYRAEMEIAANRCHAPWFNVTASGMENTLSTRSAEEARADLETYVRNVSSGVSAGDFILLPTILRLVAICLVDLGEFELAAKLSGLIPKLRGLGEKGTMSPGYDRAVETLSAAMPKTRLDALREIGRGWDLDDVVEVLEAAVEA